MTTRSTIFLVLSFSILSLLLGLAVYPYLPDQVANHWNAYGQVDGYTTKISGIILIPIIILATGALMIFLPRLDPLKANVAGFQGSYYRIVVLMAGFLFYLQGITLAWNLGWNFNLVMALTPAYAVLFYFIGILVEKAHRNWFIGIRTPWTMSSDIVWEKTHRLGGKLFKFCAALTLLGMFFPDYALFFMVIPVLSIALGLIFYSYYAYQQEAR
jgi:uncharacterized membrane protein